MNCCTVGGLVCREPCSLYHVEGIQVDHLSVELVGFAVSLKVL